MTREQPHAKGVRPDFGQTIMTEHLGRKILDVVRHDNVGLGGDRRGDNVSVLPLCRRLAHALDGGNDSWCWRDIGNGKGPFHFAAPIFDLIDRDAHAGMQVPHPFRVDIVGPDWFEGLRFGDMKKQVGKSALKQDAGVENGDG